MAQPDTEIANKPEDLLDELARDPSHEQAGCGAMRLARWQEVREWLIRRCLERAADAQDTDT